MDFEKKPSLRDREIYILKNNNAPIIAIVTPFYNGGETLDETAKTVLSQTYPFFEWIIVDDGSKDEKSLKKLADLEKKDSRIKVYHQENGGPAAARDNGISKASESVKYILFLDCDDMMDNTMLETMYWTLETHPRASFTYTSMVNFGAREFYWEPYISLEHQKKDNLINISSMVKKEDLLEVGCFGLREKGIYEDWNLWLKLLANGKIPIRLNAPVFWYRTNDTGEFSRAKNNHARAMEIIDNTAKTIKEDVEIIQFPRIGDSAPTDNDTSSMLLPEFKRSKKKNVLFLFPWAVVGGADVFNLELLKRIDKEKYNCIVMTTLPMQNPLRQEMEQYVNEYYDLSNFLDYRDYPLFVDYITKSRNIDIAFTSNTVLGYGLLTVAKNANPSLFVVDYVHSIDLKDFRGGFGKYSKELEDIIDYTLTCNNFTKKQLEDDYNKHNVETVYIGTDEKKYDASKFNSDELKKEYNIPLNKTIIGFIARLSYEKRPLMFIDIANELLKKNKDLVFIVGGDGPEMQAVRNKIDEYGINDNVILLGMIKESGKFFSMCDLTINCSLLEGLALTSYESLAMGVPVVSADVGGQSELINDTVGKIIPNNFKTDKDEINLYVDSTLAVLKNISKLKKNCRKKILDGFTLDLMVKHIEEVFSRGNTTLIKKPSFVEAIYSYYAEKMRPYVNGLISNYYEEVHHLVLTREDDYSKFVKLKTYFRGISYKYYLEKEMYFVFKVLRHLYRGIRSIVISIISFIKFIILFIPMLYNVLHIIVRIVRLKMKNK